VPEKEIDSVRQLPVANSRYSIFSTLMVSAGRPFLKMNLTFWQPGGGVAELATGMAWTLDLSFGSARISAPRTSVAAIAIMILLIALLLVVSLSAGRIQTLSPQELKISASRTFGRIGLSNTIAERGRPARFFNLHWRESLKHVAGFFVNLRC
jgi:hypothetical protein